MGPEEFRAAGHELIDWIADYRARIPELTEAGNRVQHALIAARDQAEAAALCQFSADEQRVLRALLNRLAEGPTDDPKATGSCM